MTTSTVRTSLKSDSFTDILGPLKGDKTSPNGSGQEAGDKRANAEREKRQIYSIHGEQVRAAGTLMSSIGRWPVVSPCASDVVSVRRQLCRGVAVV